VASNRMIAADRIQSEKSGHRHVEVLAVRINLNPIWQITYFLNCGAYKDTVRRVYCDRIR